MVKLPDGFVDRFRALLVELNELARMLDPQEIAIPEQIRHVVAERFRQNRCIRCGKPVKVPRRGLCQEHYNWANYRIKMGRRSPRQLVEKGWWLTKEIHEQLTEEIADALATETLFGHEPPYPPSATAGVRPLRPEEVFPERLAAERMLRAGPEATAEMFVDLERQQREAEKAAEPQPVKSAKRSERAKRPEKKKRGN